MLKRLIVLGALAVGVAACGGGPSTGADASATATGNGDGASVEAYCELARELDANEEQFADFDPSNPESIGEMFDEIAAALDQLVEVAPAEVRAEIEQGRTLFVEMKLELEKVDYDFSKISPEVAQRFQEIGAFFENSELNSFNETECGIAAES